MSHDVFFWANERLNRESFINYFKERAHYTLQGPSAVYGNEDTGTYFSFEWMDPVEDGEETEDEGPPPDAMFNINFFRPSFFAREAEPEVAAFIRHFEPQFDDPQTGGMGKGPYTAEGFLRGWDTGNQLGARAFRAQGTAGSTPHTLSRAENNRIWQWNLGRNARQEQVVEDLFVPQIMLAHIDNAVRSLVAWTDGIPILLPKVDYLVLQRKALAPRRFFVRREAMLLARWSDLAPLLPRFKHSALPTETWTLPYSATVPADIVAWFQRDHASANALKGNLLSTDSVLDAELFEEASA